jgi:hypothetical protein
MEIKTLEKAVVLHSRIKRLEALEEKLGRKDLCRLDIVARDIDLVNKEAYFISLNNRIPNDVEKEIMEAGLTAMREEVKRLLKRDRDELKVL